MNPRALVVDDDRVSRLVLSHMVRQLGHDVDEASDVRSAVEALRRTCYDVVLCDYWLPDGTGADVRSRLPAGPAGPRLVFVTGAGEVGAEISTGCDLLTKPVGTSELDRCLGRTSDRGS